MGEGASDEQEIEKAEREVEEELAQPRTILDDLLKFGKNVKPLGQFAVGGVFDLPLPGRLRWLLISFNFWWRLFLGLNIAEFGDISFPVYERQAKDLISKCEKAPFGRKDQTLRDDKVRDTWQIDASQVSLHC